MRIKDLAIVAAIVSATVATAAPATPSIDRSKLESYIRYAEGFGPEIRIQLDAPVASSFPGYYRLVAHLFSARGTMDRVYYLSADGTQILNGTIWSLNGSPFLDTLLHLPQDGAAFGARGAKVTLVIFSDFQCPYCRAFARVIRQNIPGAYSKDVRVIFQDFPIDTIHEWARAAAEAGRCVNAQRSDSFWAFHDWIFEHQGEINKENLKEKVLEFAEGEKLDRAKLSDCMSSSWVTQQVDQSVQAGRALQIETTPTSFVNGRSVSGAVSWSELNALIQLELKHTTQLPAVRTR